jgi:hypothetical protein
VLVLLELQVLVLVLQELVQEMASQELLEQV